MAIQTQKLELEEKLILNLNEEEFEKLCELEREVKGYSKKNLQNMTIRVNREVYF